MYITIPLWFYGFDSVMYLISSFIGFLIAFNFYKIYSLSSEKKHMYLYLGFLLVSLGLLNLSISSIFSYTVFKNCHVSCTLGLIDNVFSLEDFSYFIYFGLSLAGYTLLGISYNIEDMKFSRIFILLFLAYLIFIFVLMSTQKNHNLWYSYSEYFHLSSLIIAAFISFRSIVNYDDKKTTNSFLVMISFILISSFHLFYLFSYAGGWVYIFSHILLLSGFSTLLAMVLRVKNK